MASKKQSKKSSQGKPASKSIDGLKRANAVRRQLARWRERQWPLNDDTAPEWLRFAHALKAQAEVLVAEAGRVVNPSLFQPLSNTDLARARARADVDST